MKLLALRLCEHDSNISYFDGRNVKYFKSERLYKEKHHAYDDLWQWRQDIKKLWDLDYSDIDEIAVVLDPWVYGFPSHDDEEFFPAMPYDLFPAKCKVWRINHHYAHALSGWMLPKTTKQIVIDGFGEMNNSWTVFVDDKIAKIGKVSKDGSIGLNIIELSKSIGIQCRHDADIAGKLMGLQSYGTYDENFAKLINHLTISQVDSLFNFDNYVNYKKDFLLADLNRLSWARTIHEQTSKILIDLFKKYCDKNDYIFYSGGVAQNVLWNTKLKEQFPNLIVSPHSSDEGLSLGALEWLRRKNNLPEFVLDQFPFVQSDEFPSSVINDNQIEKVAELLASGKIVAWYQGNGEIGPRALGNRSILMDPRIKNGKQIINKIKRRENYRPFGASVLLKDKEKYFSDLPKNPYMLYVGNVIDETIESVTHVDKTCRAQTVDESNGDFYKLLLKFKEKTGCSVLLNTSLNLSGSPIASSIKDAAQLFKSEPIDCLVIGGSIFVK